MIIKKNFKDGVDIIYYEESTKVVNSYLLDDDEVERVAIEIAFSRSTKYDWRCIYLRNEKSYMQEIRAHNRLYNLGLWVSHTIDTDLEEEIDIIHKFIYWLLGR